MFQGVDMIRSKYTGAIVAAAFGIAALGAGALASTFNIPAGDLNAALNSYAKQAGVQLMYSDKAVKGVRTGGAKGDLSADAALSRILENTGFEILRESGAIAIVRSNGVRGADELLPAKIAAAPAASATSAALETVTVTSSKIGGDVQN